MAKLQLMIDDELMLTLKLHVLQEKTTIKEYITHLIQESFDTSIKESSNLKDTKIKESKNHAIKESNDTKIQESNDTKPTTKYEWEDDGYVNPLSDDYQHDPYDERYFYVLRKTAIMDIYPETHETEKTNGILRWTLPPNAVAHFDKDGQLIPFRYSIGLTRYEPTPAQIKEIEKAYGKPVTIEPK
jgi:hypothetical protein